MKSNTPIAHCSTPNQNILSSGKKPNVMKKSTQKTIQQLSNTSLVIIQKQTIKGGTIGTIDIIE